MGKLATLKILDGNFEHGFSVCLQIGEEGAHPTVEVMGKLPAAPEMPLYYSRWQSNYEQLGLRSRLSAKEVQVTNVSTKATLENCHNTAQILRARLNTWFRAEEFRPVREKWLERLKAEEEIRFIVQTENSQLRRLPWNLLDLLERYPRTEIALSAPNYEQPDRSHLAKANTSPHVKILAILGHSEGIDTQADRQLLEQLPQAQVQFLVEPDRKTLTDTLWSQPWDILFFAGHSASQQDGSRGCIYLNPTDSLTISELKYALRRAVEQGLQLALFNSCDGLGLAWELAELHIPQLVVMREPVPDRVAQEFLKYFLEGFSHGLPFYLAVRQARERLQGLEDRFPCASWLPVICQNPAAIPPAWHHLYTPVPVAPPRRAAPIARHLPWAAALLSGLVATGVVSGIRWLGGLQMLELQTFDQMMRLRPDDEPDPRLFIVTIDDQDIARQVNQGELDRGSSRSLSDQSLQRLLAILQQHQPRVIGLDIYRDFPATPGLKAQLAKTPNLVGICEAGDAVDRRPGIGPMPELSEKQVGFSNFVWDDDRVVRRHLLTLKPASSSRCKQGRLAFSYQLAYQYLTAQNSGRPPQTAQLPDGSLQINQTVFRKLKARQGPYQQVDTGGTQTLLNYHTIENARQLARSASLRDVLSGFDLSEIEGKIVLIGVVASDRDRWQTPYNRGAETTAGVFVQAHMVSQIVSAVLDNRPLLWFWNGWVETLWIATWGVIGGSLVWVVRSSSYRVLALSGAIVLLYGVCFLVLAILAGWLPFIPAIMALGVSGLLVYTYRQAQLSRYSGFHRH